MAENRKDTHSLGFRIERRAPDLRVQGPIKSRFRREFPKNNVYERWPKTLRIVSISECANLLAESDILTSLTLDSVVRQVKARASSIARYPIKPKVKDVVLGKRKGGGTNIGLLLDDSTGQMQADRNGYLQAIAGLAHVPVPELTYSPDITLAKVNGSEEAAGFFAELVAKAMVGTTVNLTERNSRVSVPHPKQQA